MSSNETRVMREIRVLASKLGARLFRQNTGVGWIGKAERAEIAKTVRLKPGDVVIRKARPFHAGFEGLSDLGGWVPVTITDQHVGKTLAVVLQAEIKDKGKATAAQLRWIAAVNAAGGIAGVVRTDIEFRALIGAASGSNQIAPE